MFTHVLSYNYIEASKPIEDVIPSGSQTSLNAIFFAAILLSSRLVMISHVFVLMFQSLSLFGFLPYFRQEMRQKSEGYYKLLAVGSTLFDIVIIFLINKVAAVFYLLFVLVLTIGCPLLLIYAYKFKNDIRGPWDLPNVREYKELS